MSRHRLHATKLNAFAAWLMTQGWVKAAPKAQYEMLRMVRPVPRATLLVHRRDEANAGEHLTLHGESERWFSRWLEARKLEEMEAEA